MNIYLLEQNDNCGYDTYDSMVVYAESKDAARQMLPAEYAKFDYGSSWAHCPENVIVTKIGTALPGIEVSGIIITSFNAG